MTDIKPGLIYGMSDETYHGDPVPGGSLSSSLARRLTEHVPAKAIATHRNRKPTKSMNLGKAAHLHALGAGPELVVWEHDGRTKAGKEERADRADDVAAERVVAVTEAERDQVLGMVDALRANPEVAAMLDSGEPEVSAFWQEQGAWCRARFDLLGPVAYDYKTTEDASARGFEHAMATYGYHQQADFYLRGLRALGHPAGDQPDAVHLPGEAGALPRAGPHLRRAGYGDRRRAQRPRHRHLRRRHQERRVGRLPELCTPSRPALPARYFYRHADLLPGHLNPYAEPEMSM